MRIVIIFLILLTSSVYGQVAKSMDFDLRGSWTVIKFNSAKISAMTDEQAREWKGKKATVIKVIHFPYYDIPSYKDVFKQSYCPYLENRHIYLDTIVATDKYFEQIKINYHGLGIKSKNIRIVRTPCTDTPFHEIIVKDNNEILIFWDGVFFTLIRDKT